MSISIIFLTYFFQFYLYADRLIHGSTYTRVHTVYFVKSKLIHNIHILTTNLLKTKIDSHLQICYVSIDGHWLCLAVCDDVNVIVWFRFVVHAINNLKKSFS
jgi:hypothetical protein